MRTHDVTGQRLPPRHARLRSVVLLAGLGLGSLLPAGCSTPAATRQSEASPAQPSPAQPSPTPPVQAGRPVEIVEALLRDKKTTERDGRIAWTTTWRICFKPDRADTTRMEAQAVTPEGSGHSLRKLDGKCLELGVASGKGEAGAGMNGRDTQLAEAAALAYRVRAVHGDGTVTPWTEPIPAGTTKP